MNELETYLQSGLRTLSVQYETDMRQKTACRTVPLP